jgi:rfaE bifunctional protein nucleotidyltransferase chain/domain
MQNAARESIGNKIRTLCDIGPLVAQEQKRGIRVVHCHGVFDLLHPGHLRHLQEARAQGDKLVVSVTPDRFVNKGPGRPAFHEELRLEQLAALVYVDYVVLNDKPDAISIIKLIRPDIYVKGAEYRNHSADLTAKIGEEASAVESVGGTIYYTDDIVYSSSELINRFFDEDAVRIAPFMETLKKAITLEDLWSQIERFSKLKVLVVGDAIIDEYQYVEPLGQSGKGVHLTARLLEKEVFLGGSLIIANHLSSFVKEVTLVTAVGRTCGHLPLIHEKLGGNVESQLLHFDHLPTLTKTRFVLKDGQTITKLFETYSSNDSLLQREHTEHLLSFLEQRASEFDLILVSDFGNGFTNPAIVSALSATSSFLAVNTQTNSGNRGYNVVTHYHRADFISLNEPELRLAAHDRFSRLETVASDIATILRCPLISVTRGVNGVFIHSSQGLQISIPALTTRSVDRVGAGDSYFVLASLCAATGASPLMTGFLGSAAAAMGVQIVGNKEPIAKVPLSKYLTRLMK